MFTIVIPLYNKAAYIEKAIYSVLNQTFKEFELIIIDDGSIDNPLPPKGGSLKLRLRNFGDITKKITLIEQQNQGVSSARNKGFEVAKYDYIAFLDADDWWSPTFLEEMKCLIEEYPHAGIFGCSYFKVKNGQTIQANIGVDLEFKSGIINYLQVYAKTLYMPLTSISTIIKRSTFESVLGFKPTLKLGEDFDMWVRVATKYEVAFLNKPLAFYNQDVEFGNRAIGDKFYEACEHMLFTDYGDLQNNSDFRYLFEKLCVYSLLPYYLENKNEKEVSLILKGIHWGNHNFKYRLYYLILPKIVVKIWMKFLKVGSKVKTKILS